jgi:hypothetical protein
MAAAATASAPTSRAVGPRRLSREPIGHLRPLLGGNFLHASPPLRHLARSETEVRPQQQQIISGAKARMLQHPQSSPPTRMLQTRLKPKHLPHTQREALRNRDVRLRLARGAIACVQNRPELVPALRRGRFDDAGNRPIQQQSEQERRSDRLVREHARVGVLQPAYQQLLDQAARVRFEIARHRRQQRRQQTAALQDSEALRAVSCQE